jgi:aminopeptidase
MAFDVEMLADRVIRLLDLHQGQVIWIWASTYSLDLVEALAYRIRAAGAFWTLRLGSETLQRRIGLEAPEEYLALVPEHELRWLADVDAIIGVQDHSGHIPDVPVPRRRALGTEWRALIDEANRRGCRRISVLNPTLSLAKAYGMTLDDLCMRYSGALDIDDAVLDASETVVAQALDAADAIRITSELGTDLHLRKGRRPVHQDHQDLPRGEVYVAPHEDSANGVAVIDALSIRDKLARRLALTFVDGRVARVESPDAADAAAFWELLAASRGDKDVIAELGIGLNPGISEAIGQIAFDEKIGGTIHIAIGMNTSFGGKNRANLHLDMVVQRPTVELDSASLIVNGVLTGTARPDGGPYAPG